MYRTALRSVPRPALRSTLRCRAQPAATRRLASTSSSPADKPRTWKGAALRWGLAAGALYYYNTSAVFADEAAPQTVSAPPSFADSDLPTVDSVLEEKRKQIHEKLEQKKQQPQTPADEKSAAAAPSTPSQASTATDDAGAVQGAGALEEEAGQEGAFNPETGEINWDCPCLGGMAHGPCGEEFKTAFSCFVYSTEEPKGMDCIEKFQGMQECFRQYPDIYGAELADEEEAAAQEVEAQVAASPEPPEMEYQKLRDEPPTAAKGNRLETENLPGAAPVNVDVPKKWEDATDAGQETPKEVADEQEKAKQN